MPWTCLCSTPFGITAWFTGADLAKLRDWTVCSTPFGITAWFTRVTYESLGRLSVLNAFRHHSLVHAHGTALKRTDGRAQRLSASQLGS